MAINTRDRRHAALLDQVVIFPDVDAEGAQDRAWMQQSYYIAEGAPAIIPVDGSGSIDDTLDADFYGGTTAVASSDELLGWNVALDGHTYIIDVTKYQRSILDISTPQNDDAAEAGEKSLSRQGFWIREQTDWRHGAGQEFFDGVDSIRTRYFASKNVDPWTRGRLCLLHDTIKKFTSVAANFSCFDIGERLYLIDGQFLRFTLDPTLETPAFTNIDCDATIADTTTDGNRIYIAFGGANPLKVVDVGGTTDTVLGTETPDIVEFANGRLIGADGKRLYELSSAGVATNIRDDFRTNWLWKCITGHPEAIFAAGTVNNYSEFYATAADPDTGALLPPAFAGHLPRGETVNCMGQYAGVIVIGTSRGLRVATVANRSLSIGKLIEISGGVTSLAMFERFVWFSWPNFDTTSTGLGRADLSVNVDDSTFVPAYASDIMANNLQGTVQGIAIVGDRRYFAVNGSGLWAETQYLAPLGYVESGDIRFSVSADKIFTGVEIRHDALKGTVGADVLFDDDSSRSLGFNGQPNSTISVLDDAQGIGLGASLRINLSRSTDDATQGPCIRNWVLNGLPRPKRSLEIILPVILKTKVVDLRKNEVLQDPLKEMRHLEDLASSRQLVVYQEGDATYGVRVSSVGIDAEGIRGWIRAGEVVWFECTALVRLLTKEA